MKMGMVTVVFPLVTGFRMPFVGMLGALAPPVSGYLTHMYCKGEMVSFFTPGAAEAMGWGTIGAVSVAGTVAATVGLLEAGRMMARR